MHICTFTIPGKVAQASRWIITQDHPWPDIATNGGELAWRNFGGLFGSYGTEATGIAPYYRCNLAMAEGEIPEDYNRRHFAGYASKPGDPETPGTLTLRGRSLGEMSIEFNLAQEPIWPVIRVRGFDAPTPGERDWIKTTIIPPLLEFVKAHATDLRQEAINATLKKMRAEIAEARATIEKLERQIETAKF